MRETHNHGEERQGKRRREKENRVISRERGESLDPPYRNRLLPASDSAQHLESQPEYSESALHLILI